MANKNLIYLSVYCFKNYFLFFSHRKNLFYLYFFDTNFLQIIFLQETIKYSEEELIQLLKSADQSAFSYLYDHYSGALYGVIFKIIGERALAEDILQEAFVKIWSNFSSYDSSKGRLFTWMLNITRNLTIDTLRSKSYKKQSKIHGSENAVNYAGNNVNENEKFDAMGIRKQTLLLKPIWNCNRLPKLPRRSWLTGLNIRIRLSVPTPPSPWDSFVRSRGSWFPR